MFKTKAKSSEGAPLLVHSSADVSRLTGVSLRQLQWWDEQRVVSPRHEGHKRVYSMEEVLEISMIAELRRKGFSLQKIRRVLKLMQKEMSRRLGQILAGERDMHLLTDGKTIHLEDAPERVVDLLKASRQPMFLVCVTDQLKRLTSTPRKPPKSETLASAPARRVRAL
jgi:DNA-binding transcriptional MerR regulator